jgi:hypothetical protein
MEETGAVEKLGTLEILHDFTLVDSLQHQLSAN